ncbi:MAG: hypothetical protein J3Q66DRAFT_328831 [Benniella sp.]|nr:MAG: hypothetical protein J3Q66DRAFT_328831 [Benniella sp.]
MSDSIDFESEDEQGLGNNSRRQRYLGKRRAREPDDFEETMGAIFKEVWREPGVKVQKEALQLSAEYLRLFTIEALHRTAAYQREQEDEELKNEESLIELDSLEAITPQLVLDF